MDSGEEYPYDSDFDAEMEECEEHVGTDEEFYELDGGDRDSDYIFAANHRQPKSFTVLKEEDIRQRQKNDVADISNVLAVSRGEAFALLRRYDWTVSRVHEEWFSDEQRVRRSVGIPVKSLIEPLNSSMRFTCQICFQSRKSYKKLSAACGHPFCIVCWKTYIRISIKDEGPGCLELKCPEPSCTAISGLEIIELLASAKGKKKYYKYLLWSYIDGNSIRKWCPAPRCENAVEYSGGGENYDVICDCSHKFCWNCTEEVHRPVDCKTVANWHVKNGKDADNAKWILAYTKQCPKCRRAIEKNQGCNHMTCRQPCGFSFCWLCLGPWKTHKSCNQYRAENSIDEQAANVARRDLERYAHYYERWKSSDESRKMAMGDLKRAKEEHIRELERVQGEHGAQLSFVTEAWEQIIECRLVLKWTYAYGYFIEDDDASGKKRFFEYVQGEAEHALERLHHCAEKEMEKYLESDEPVKGFCDFRAKLVSLTRVTKDFFENLVRALENNLEEVKRSALYMHRTR